MSYEFSSKKVGIKWMPDHRSTISVAAGVRGMRSVGRAGAPIAGTAPILRARSPLPVSPTAYPSPATPIHSRRGARQPTGSRRARPDTSPSLIYATAGIAQGLETRHILGVTGDHNPIPPKDGMMRKSKYVYEPEVDGYRCPKASCSPMPPPTAMALTKALKYMGLRKQGLSYLNPKSFRKKPRIVFKHKTKTRRKIDGFVSNLSPALGRASKVLFGVCLTWWRLRRVRRRSPS